MWVMRPLGGAVDSRSTTSTRLWPVSAIGQPPGPVSRPPCRGRPGCRAAVAAAGGRGAGAGCGSGPCRPIVSSTVCSSSGRLPSPVIAPTTLPSWSTTTTVGQPRTPYCCQVTISGSSSTGWPTPRRATARRTEGWRLSWGNLGECTPMTTTSSGQRRCTSARSSSTRWQLTQPWVQKSSTTTRPAQVRERQRIGHADPAAGADQLRCPHPGHARSFRSALGARDHRLPCLAPGVAQPGDPPRARRGSGRPDGRPTRLRQQQWRSPGS